MGLHTVVATPQVRPKRANSTHQGYAARRRLSHSAIVTIKPRRIAVQSIRVISELRDGHRQEAVLWIEEKSWRKAGFGDPVLPPILQTTLSLCGNLSIRNKMNRSIICSLLSSLFSD